LVSGGLPCTNARHRQEVWMDQLGITSLSSLTVKLVHKIMSLFWLFLLVMYAQPFMCCAMAANCYFS
jgi:hypothetical protein